MTLDPTNTDLTKFPVLRIRIPIGSGFNQVLRFGFGIRIGIQGQESEEEKNANIKKKI